ncbi:VENN motif pre-toxin domain-containing protein [Bisgaard Taxon 10/6]|nr:VENN motif pre-toxin domain-containing protein [Exercitatus varius]MDG2959188.1 VENN motif pre-toxin domain-containing protein [Exercitatus varius]
MWSLLTAHKGGDYQLAVRAVTGVLQGLATGNQNAAWVNGLSPYANNLIKTYTTDEQGQVNTTANLMAHAMLGALEAYATGNHAAAGAAGAITSEVAAKLITEQLYHTDPSKLTDDQKQVVATLSQVTAGLAGIVTSDSTQSAVSAAEIGKRAVENNELFGYSADTLTGLAMKARADAVIAPIEQQANKQVQEIATKLAEFGVDMTPLLGDGKAFYDAEDGIDYILATIGVLPGADAITKPLKEAKDLYQAAKKAELLGDSASVSKYLEKAFKQLEQVKALDVDSYKNLRTRSVVGDNIDLDHIPSFAALKKSKESELGRKLSPIEEKSLRDEATAVAVPKDVHMQSRTYAGRNSKDQIVHDANNLCRAQECDLNKMRTSLIEKGYNPSSVEDAINEIIQRNNSRGIK